LVEGQQYSRRVGNTGFTVVPFSVAITPVKTGTASMNPIKGSVLLNNPDPRDMFFGSRLTPQQAPLTSPQLDLQVSQLPTENVPPRFNGAVGSYTMAVTAGPTNLVAGDPITLRIQISGHGALDSIALPDQPGLDNFKTYPPTAKVNATDAFGIEGSKTFEEIVTPQNSDIHALPAISFSYFDPEQKKYKTLVHPATPLIVRAATPGSMPAAPTAVHPENSQPTADVIPLKQHLGELAQIRPPLVQQPWFLALQGVPVLALMSSVILRKRKESLANNPRLRRQRQVAQLVREGLQQLHRLAAENKSDEFFATLFRLLQEQLGERLDLPASAITEAVIDERLRPRGVPVETLALLHELFQMCNLARYAPIKSSQELAAIIPKLESAMNQLRELRT
ncbi:MAG TPA: BatD family protein, partial [Verrucomicrobiae bacterium]|nr:BatD family protein [Verrucomicrobiae bacterium]